MYGFLIVDPADDPGRYDQEVLLAAHHWEGKWVSMQDIRKGPPPDNGLEVLYASASFNDKMLGHGEPVRVREGERVLFRLLNASPTENITLALPGHRFTVIALDGNPVPSPRSRRHAVSRAGGTCRRDRGDEPAGCLDPRRDQGRGPQDGPWRRRRIRQPARRAAMGGPAQFRVGLHDLRHDRPVPAPDERLELLFEKVPGGRGGYNRWTINGKSWPPPIRCSRPSAESAIAWS